MTNPSVKIDNEKLAAHTPGPWSVQSEWDVWCGPADNPNAPLVRPNTDYRRWGREISHEERCANARLIAAAPDLLSLLEACEEYFDNRSDVVDGDYGIQEPNTEMRMLTEIRAALAKAAQS